MQILVNIPKEYKDMLDKIEYAKVNLQIAHEIFSAISNGLVIPNSATNGDMLKVMFPNANEWEVTEPKAVAGHYFNFGDGTIKIFSLAWWNAPYKGDKEGGK